jgi:hypothetical protein
MPSPKFPTPDKINPSALLKSLSEFVNFERQPMEESAFTIDFVFPRE